MVSSKRQKISLYEEAKAGFSSLIGQTATVFIGFVVMLLITGGVPSSFVVALSFCLGTAFVAWSEQRRVTKLKSTVLDEGRIQSEDSTSVRIIGDHAMDKIAKYREYIQVLLTRYASDDVSNDEVEVQLIFDIERDHYQWMNIGWQQFDRIYRCVIHFDIKNGKIWLQQNLTDRNPAEDLVTMGVPRKDIVLGLQPPYKRQYTDYGVA